MSPDIYKGQWNESYARGENFIFYPKEEVVRFLNRFVRKRVAVCAFVDILDFSKQIRGLDFGCGIGRQAVLMREFGVDAYGYDISVEAVGEAKKIAKHFGFDEMVDKFIIGDGHSIPFEKDFFDITISDSVLDSMSFELAKKAIKEISRVTRHLVFISLISGDDDRHYQEFRGEEIVTSQHEQGTLQNYFDWHKIQELIEETDFRIQWCHLVTETSLLEKYRYGRYYVVLKRDDIHPV